MQNAAPFHLQRFHLVLPHAAFSGHLGQAGLGDGVVSVGDDLLARMKYRAAPDMTAEK